MELDNDLMDLWLKAGMAGLGTEEARDLIEEVQTYRNERLDADAAEELADEVDEAADKVDDVARALEGDDERISDRDDLTSAVIDLRDIRDRLRREAGQ